MSSEVSTLARERLKKGESLEGLRTIRASEVPQRLTDIRDTWRRWSWVPILGRVYELYYQQQFRRWFRENNIGFIDHS